MESKKNRLPHNGLGSDEGLSTNIPKSTLKYDTALIPEDKEENQTARNVKDATVNKQCVVFFTDPRFQEGD